MTRARYGCSTQLSALLLIALVTAAVLALAGCATTTSSDVQNVGRGEVTTTWVHAPDGRSVLCVIWTARGNRGGIDCDWATASLEGEAP